MCQFASFFHNITNGEVKVFDLTSHGNTEKELNLNHKVWREGHYLPNGTLELRFNDEDRVDRHEYEEKFRNRFPTFIDFLVWALKNVAPDGKYSGSLDLRSLTSLPEKVVLPEKISGSLDLRSLTSLPEKVVLPKECGYLDLSSLTSLPEKVVLPEKISGFLDLSSDLRKIWDEIVYKQKKRK